MKNTLIVKNIGHVLDNPRPEYKSMISNINERMPDIRQASSNFYKGHSQFMNVTVDVTAITPIRSIKHSLAEIEKTKEALNAAYIAAHRTQLKIKKKQQKLNKCCPIQDELKIEKLKLDILQLESETISGQNYVKGAIRKLNFFINQYDSLLKHLGITEVTEEMYEKEEARYHIMTAMKQALSAARSKAGLIDEGNQIYLFDIGINGAQAQVEVFNYLKMENQMIKEGIQPTHEMSMRWLEACADKFASDPQTFAERRGFKLLDKKSLTNLDRQIAAE